MQQGLRHRDDGFTLIELLVVVIIIGILAAVAIPTFMNQRERAFRATVQSDLRNFAVQAETFYTDNGTYDGLTTAGFTPSPNVTIAVDSATADAYCVDGVHSSASADTYTLEEGNVISGPGDTCS